MRFKHYSIRTERTYREWIRRFILFHGKRHPRAGNRRKGRSGTVWAGAKQEKDLYKSCKVRVRSCCNSTSSEPISNC
jgi:hypothetical protein